MKTAILLCMGTLLGTAVPFGAGPPPAHASITDRMARRVWFAPLDQAVGPDMAGCIRLEVKGHPALVDLDARLAQAADDARLYPRLQRLMDAAEARCRRRHGDP